MFDLIPHTRNLIAIFIHFIRINCKSLSLKIITIIYYIIPSVPCTHISCVYRFDWHSHNIYYCVLLCSRWITFLSSRLCCVLPTVSWCEVIGWLKRLFGWSGKMTCCSPNPNETKPLSLPQCIFKLKSKALIQHLAAISIFISLLIQLPLKYLNSFDLNFSPINTNSSLSSDELNYFV